MIFENVGESLEESLIEQQPPVLSRVTNGKRCGGLHPELTAPELP